MQLLTRQMSMKFTSPWRKQTVNQQVNKQEKQMIVRIHYHSNGRKRRGTKEPLDEGEGGE